MLRNDLHIFFFYNLSKESLTLIGMYHPEAVRSTLLKFSDETHEFTTNVQEVLRRLKSSS